MASHHTSLGKPQQASAAHTLAVAQRSDLLLQACGLGSAQDSDQFSQTLQGEVTPRKRGRPQQIGWTQLWCSLLLCTLQGMHSFADWRRLLGFQSIGPFAAVWLTRNGLVKRLLQAGLCPLQELWEEGNARLAHIGSQAVSPTLATFATNILCLDAHSPRRCEKVFEALTQLELAGSSLLCWQTGGSRGSACPAVAPARMAQGGA